jgi:hypothetical protein
LYVFRETVSKWRFRAAKYALSAGSTLPVRGDDRVDHLGDGRGVVPLVRVVALLQADDVADVEHDAARDRVCVEQLGRPAVVADPVHDHDLRAGQRARVARGRLVVVRVGVRVDDQARHRHLRARQLLRDAAPEVLGRDDLELRRGALCRGGRRNGDDNGKQQGYESGDAHACDSSR